LLSVKNKSIANSKYISKAASGAKSYQNLESYEEEISLGYYIIFYNGIGNSVGRHQ